MNASLEANLGTAVNAQLVSKFHVALHVSHAALKTLTSKFPPDRNTPNVKKISS
jgi:hypothetical protein